MSKNLLLFLIISKMKIRIPFIIFFAFILTHCVKRNETKKIVSDKTMQQKKKKSILPDKDNGNILNLLNLSPAKGEK